MEGSIEAIRALRGRGIPVVGYTWWPLFSLVGWAYRQRATRSLESSLLHMGLWDLHAEGERMVRIETPLVDRYARIVRDGAAAVGAIAGTTGQGA